MTKLIMISIMWIMTMFQSPEIAKWYDLHGKKTSSGQVFDRNAMTCAASSKYKLGQVLEVTNTQNNKKIRVTVNDRGNFEKDGVSLDLSPTAFKNLAPLNQGVIRIKIKKL